MKLLSIIFIFVYSITTFAQAEQTQTVRFTGDSNTKLFYPRGCAEISGINSADRVAFADKVEAESKGFKLADICSKPRPQLYTPLSINNSSLAEDEKQPEEIKPMPSVIPEKVFRKPQKARNLLTVLTDPDYWADRLITVEGAAIKLGPLPNKDEFTKKTHQGFIITDASQSLNIVAVESKQTEFLRNQILQKNGGYVFGTFSFIIAAENFKTIGRSFGSLDSYSLRKDQ